ncbi:MAG: GntR family transcriptional regulator [Victivallales bacterium]
MDAAWTSNEYAGKRSFGLPAHIMLAERLHSMIKSGALKPGYRFPPTKEFASQLKTYPLAVHEAFKILSGEGLVERRHRSGTFVSSSSSVLGSVAIYLGMDIMGSNYLNFYRLVYAELENLLKNEGIRYSTLIDPRGDDRENEPWEDLARSIERKKYQGIIALVADEPRMKWLSRLNVPVSSFNDMRSDMYDFAMKSVTALKDKGCRSCGIITSLLKNSKFPKQVMDAAKRHNMKMNNEWIMLPEEEWVPGPAMERFGYEQFPKIWNLKRRPDGLIVFPDTLLPGIIAAMVQVKARVPEDFKFAIHMNKGNGILCPFPAAFIVSDPKDYAVALVKQLKIKISGQDIVPEDFLFETMEFKTQGGS